MARSPSGGRGKIVSALDHNKGDSTFWHAISFCSRHERAGAKHDYVETHRTDMPDLSSLLRFASGAVDEFVRWKANRLSRTRCGSAAASLSNTSVLAVWLRRQ